MNYKKKICIVYCFLSFVISINASWKSSLLYSLPLPVSLGFIYQVGKSYENNPLNGYLNQGSLDFIGYKNRTFTVGVIGSSSEKSSHRYCGFPLTVFLVGFCLHELVSKLSGQTKLKDFKKDFSSLAMGVGLTFAWSCCALYLVNPFLWKRSDGSFVNTIFKLS